MYIVYIVYYNISLANLKLNYSNNFLIRKLSVEESDAEFEASDQDENNFITWDEYVGIMHASNDDYEDEVNI